jgi:hypothetical protein
MNTEPIYGTFHDALTGDTVVRELTAEEIDKMPKPTELGSDNDN